VRGRSLGAVLAVLVLALVTGCSRGASTLDDNPVWADPGTQPTAPTPPRPTAPQPVKPRTAEAETPAGIAPSNPGTGGGAKVPTRGSGSFTAAPGSSARIGAGRTLIKVQVEVESGISWGSTPRWTADSFADSVGDILADPRGWVGSAKHPVTLPAEDMARASWSFQRVSNGSYGVRIRLATPATVDRQCGAAGLQTVGQYSCRFGKTIMINLRRWLQGTTGFTNLPAYRTMVINHEVGHYLGFNHMKCPGPGKLAPVMQQQTIDLDGCRPNPYPYDATMKLVVGPWSPS
jgi:hypothetical protein